jgi:uncharacterized membrane protein
VANVAAPFRNWAPAAFALAVLSSTAATVAAPAELVAAEEQQGARVLRAVEDGKRLCTDLSTQEFERVGEYVMGRMAGSTSAHRSMNDLMARMMGERSEERMHELLGQRFTGCARRGTANFGAMMGMMGGMAGTGGPGMMGGRSGDGYGSLGSSGDDDSDLAAVLMVVLMAALVGLVALALWRWRPGPGRSGGSPLEALGRRFAAGEIDADEYQRRRQALGGPA